MEFPPCATMFVVELIVQGSWVVSLSLCLLLSRSNLVCLATFLAVSDFSQSSLPPLIWGHGAHVASRRVRLRSSALPRPSAGHKIRHRNLRCGSSRWDRWRCVSEEKWAKTRRKMGDYGILIFMYRFHSRAPEAIRRHVDLLTKSEMSMGSRIRVCRIRTCRSGGSIEEIYWYCSEAKEMSRDPLQIKLVY